MIESIRINPFRPDSPVDPRLFVGRQEEISQIRDAIISTAKNVPRNIFIYGDRWIGKTSLVNYVKAVAEASELSAAPLKIFAGGCTLGTCKTLEDVCEILLDTLSKTQNSAKEKVATLLKTVNGIKFGPLGIEFDRGKKDIARALVAKFPRTISRIIKEIEQDYDCFIFIVDETEVISLVKGVSSFFKSVCEQLQQEGVQNVMFIITATPEGTSNFEKDHPSFSRLFRYLNLEPLSDKEADHLVARCLEEGLPLKKINEDALGWIRFLSNGMPGLLHELGFWAFEADSDDIIDQNDMFIGLYGIGDDQMGAVKSIYQKHFHRVMTRELLSERYEAILTALAETDFDKGLSFAEIMARLPAYEGKGLNPYLGNLVKKGVLIHERKNAPYRISTRLLHLWLRMWGEGKKKQK